MRKTPLLRGLKSLGDAGLVGVGKPPFEAEKRPYGRFGTS